MAAVMPGRSLRLGRGCGSGRGAGGLLEVLAPASVPPAGAGSVAGWPGTHHCQSGGGGPHEGWAAIRAAGSSLEAVRASSAAG
jgi:hypothetical protein